MLGWVSQTFGTNVAFALANALIEHIVIQLQLHLQSLNFDIDNFDIDRMYVLHIPSGSEN
jgi:hypothetical protein